MDGLRLKNKENGFYWLLHEFYLDSNEYAETYLKIFLKCKEYNVRKAVDLAIATLPEKMASCVKARYGYKLNTNLSGLPDEDLKNNRPFSNEYVSKKLGVSENVVQKNIFKAKSLLCQGYNRMALLKNLGVTSKVQTKYPLLQFLINKDLAEIFKGYGVTTLEELTNMTKEEVKEIVTKYANIKNKRGDNKSFFIKIEVYKISDLLARNNLSFSSTERTNNV